MKMFIAVALISLSGPAAMAETVDAVQSDIPWIVPGLGTEGSFDPVFGESVTMAAVPALERRVSDVGPAGLAVREPLERQMVDLATQWRISWGTISPVACPKEDNP